MSYAIKKINVVGRTLSAFIDIVSDDRRQTINKLTGQPRPVSYPLTNFLSRHTNIKKHIIDRKTKYGLEEC